MKLVEIRVPPTTCNYSKRNKPTTPCSKKDQVIRILFKIGSFPSLK